MSARSLKSEGKKEDEDVVDKEDLERASFARLIAMNKPETCIIIRKYSSLLFHHLSTS